MTIIENDNNTTSIIIEVNECIKILEMKRINTFYVLKEKMICYTSKVLEISQGKRKE